MEAPWRFSFLHIIGNDDDDEGGSRSIAAHVAVVAEEVVIN